MTGNPEESKSRGRRSRALRLALGIGVSLSGALAYFAAGGIQAASAYVAPGPCTAGFSDIMPDGPMAQIVAFPTSGCSPTGQYRFSIWSTQQNYFIKGAPQTMIASMTGGSDAPWSIEFNPTESPTCYFQVDFGVLQPRTGPGGHTWQYTPLSSFTGEIPGCTP